MDARLTHRKCRIAVIPLRERRWRFTPFDQGYAERGGVSSHGARRDHRRVENAASIARRVLMVSLFSSTSTSLQRTTAPWATSLVSLTRWASPIGSAPAERLFRAGISLPHTV